jgi:hypothetical protein
MFLGCELEVAVELNAADEQHVGEAERSERTGKRLGLCFGGNQVVDDDDVFSLHLCREGVTESQRTNLLRKVMLVAANDRGREPCRRRGTAEREPNGDERGPYPFCLYILAPVRETSARPLVLCVALLLLGELPTNHTGQNVFAGIEAENLVRQGYLAGRLFPRGS